MYCDKCGKCRRIFAGEIDQCGENPDAPWECSFLPRIGSCEKPDDELVNLVGSTYARVLDRLGVFNQEKLAAADPEYLIAAAGGSDFSALILSWISKAQALEIDDFMNTVFHHDRTLVLAAQSIGFANPNDILEQPATIVADLFWNRCAIRLHEADVAMWKEKCTQAIAKKPWMAKWVFNSSSFRA